MKPNSFPMDPTSPKSFLGQSVKSLIVLLVLLGAVQFAQAQDTGNDLYARCDPPHDALRPVKQAWCIRYIEGVFDSTTLSLCGYEGATSGQLADIVMQYLTAHPAQRNWGAYALVVFALKGAFPCHQ
jgi:hypothetical protein